MYTIIPTCILRTRYYDLVSLELTLQDDSDDNKLIIIEAKLFRRDEFVGEKIWRVLIQKLLVFVERREQQEGHQDGDDQGKSSVLEAWPFPGMQLASASIPCNI